MTKSCVQREKLFSKRQKTPAYLFTLACTSTAKQKGRREAGLS
jgi:hypothetical protein